jgi:hypothetical protein
MVGRGATIGGSPVARAGQRRGPCALRRSPLKPQPVTITSTVSTPGPAAAAPVMAAPAAAAAARARSRLGRAALARVRCGALGVAASGLRRGSAGGGEGRCEPSRSFPSTSSRRTLPGARSPIARERECARRAPALWTGRPGGVDLWPAARLSGRWTSCYTVASREHQDPPLPRVCSKTRKHNSTYQRQDLYTAPRHTPSAPRERSCAANQLRRAPQPHQPERSRSKDDKTAALQRCALSSQFYTRGLVPGARLLP